MKGISVSALLCIVLFCGCGSTPKTDSNLISAFGANREIFDELAQLSSTGDLNCPYQKDPDICIPSGSDHLFAKLKRKTGFNDMQMYVKKRPVRVLRMPVETRGMLSISSSALGYVYGPSQPSPLVNSVWQDVEDKQAYKQITGNWYLFVSN